MNRHDAALRQYYRRIWGWLPCSWKLKKQILAEIQASVEGYLEENPQADFDQVQARFGTPQTIAAAYVEGLDADTLLQNLRVRRRFMAVIGCTCLTVLISWALYIGFATNELRNLPNAYIVVETWEGEYDPSAETGVARYYP